ncbi:hypothetical protein F9C07_1145490 [Aspergillus flavus]|uniref:Uncharacterized protein n=1 Tax=Aspergillus flavus (strain ATCC 200026 / FGSC A1120 / IAM 13836 / NRRL 3357 / JCM 12722 / SRRC 167) TaxID=332952 RepID=A0A7U2MS60_ASPFN|nr:hypothetical protein F9C07_1145490 [Aspergillus flavus]
MAPVWYFVCCLYHHASFALFASNPPYKCSPFSPFTFPYLKVNMYDDELCIHVLMTCPIFFSFSPLVFRYILMGQ